MRRNRQLNAGLITLVIIGSMLVPVGTALAQSSVTVNQTSGSTTAAPGETVQVDITIETTESGSPAIELNGVPAGWTINAIDNDGGDYNPNNYEWFWLGDSDLNGNYMHTVTYEVTIPSDASDGSYAIDAIGSSQGDEGVDDDYEDTDTLSITVEEEEQTVAEVVASQSSPENTIDLGEIQQAINWWATGSEVPNTGGETISLAEIQQLINVWATGSTVSG